jgi:tRNA U34 5-methylaminomethyl-2-thiouridine-forming methyltransferase MnmC
MHCAVWGGMTKPKTELSHKERALCALNYACLTNAQAKQARAFAPECGEYFDHLTASWKREYRHLTTACLSGMHIDNRL